MMKIILHRDVPHLGVVGDLVSVKDGYARNFLIPKGLAAFASSRSLKQLDHQKRLAAHKRSLVTAEAEMHRRKVESLSVCLQAKVAPAALNEDGQPIGDKLQKLFGSVTSRDLAAVLKSSDVTVDPRRISLDKVTTVGKFTAKVRLDGGIIATLPFFVIPEGVADIEAEKARVEAAQEAIRKERAEVAASEAAIRAQLIKEAKERAKEAAKAAKDAEPTF